MVQKGKTGPAGAASTGPSITVDKVLATAMKMIEESGVDAFSMRKLAAELGVGTPTVYWHVGNRDELFNRLIEEITDQFGRISPRGRTPAERIASISNALLREVRAHPQLIALSKTQGRGEAIFTKAQAVLAHELTASGLHGEEAAFAVATILLHLGGFIVLEDALSPDYRVRGRAGMGPTGHRDRRDHEHHAPTRGRPRPDLSVHARCDPPFHSRGSERVRMIDRVSGRAIDAGIAVTRTWTARSRPCPRWCWCMVPWIEPRVFCRWWNTCRISGSSSMTAGAMANPSRRASPALLAQHVDDLLDVMGDEPTTVVAHSFGCVVAVSAAIEHPGRFRGLGLWEPQVPWMEFWPRSVRRGLEAMAAEVDTDALAERVYASMVGDEAWRRLPEELKARRRAEGMAFQSDVVLGLSPPFRWEDLKVPSLFGVGLETWPFSQEAATRLAGVAGRGAVHDRGRRPHRPCEPSPGNLRSSCAAALPFDDGQAPTGLREGSCKTWLRWSRSAVPSTGWSHYDRSG